MKIAVQLYNFREELKLDYAGTLKKIAELGFDGVEFASNYGGISPDDMAKLIADLNLKCAGTMFSADALLDPANIAYEYAEKLHSPAVTISAMVDFHQEWRNVLEKCRRIGRNAAQHPGLVFSYHNHWAECELIDQVPAIERILAETDPAQVFVEPDVCWLTRGKIAPAEFITRHAKRIRQIHLKDIVTPENPATLTTLGKGVVDLSGVIATAKKTGVEWLIYEQDVCDDTFKCAETSLTWLKKALN